MTSSLEHLAHDLSGGKRDRTSDVETGTDVTFTSLCQLKPHVMNGLTRSGFVTPSPVQLKTIPLCLLGVDLVIQAKAGTGKTCVFAITALNVLDTSGKPNMIQTLVLVPTREVAQQIAEAIKLIGRVTENLHVKTFIGGTDLGQDKIALRECNIAVATPGRFKQLLFLKMVKTRDLKLLVLDEGDTLFSDKFVGDLNCIFEQLPAQKQMICLSATYPQSVASFAQQYMHGGQLIRINAECSFLLGVDQVYRITDGMKDKLSFCKDILMNVTFSQCIIFWNDREKLVQLQQYLQQAGFPVDVTHGDQETGLRLKTMSRLRLNQIRILIATDLVSRGIDSEFVNLVISFDLPYSVDTYTHRVGRAGRFGSVGKSFLLLSPVQLDLPLFKKMMMSNPNMKEHPGFTDEVISIMRQQEMSFYEDRQDKIDQYENVKKKLKTEPIVTITRARNSIFSTQVGSRSSKWAKQNVVWTSNVKHEDVDDEMERKIHNSFWIENEAREYLGIPKEVIHAMSSLPRRETIPHHEKKKKEETAKVIFPSLPFAGIRDMNSWNDMATVYALNNFIRLK